MCLAHAFITLTYWLLNCLSLTNKIVWRLDRVESIEFHSLESKTMSTSTRRTSKNIVSHYCNGFAITWYSKSLGMENASSHCRNKIGDWVGHLILRALAIRASGPQNALARISFHSPKSLPTAAPPISPTNLVIFHFYYLIPLKFT